MNRDINATARKDCHCTYCKKPIYAGMRYRHVLSGYVPRRMCFDCCIAEIAPKPGLHKAQVRP